MRKYALFLLAALAISLVAPAAFAQEAAGGGGGSAANWIAIAAGFSMAIASAGGAIGQGMATAHACEGLARNPGAEAAIRFALILGLVLIESMALYTFAIIFIKVK
jgi:F-type H+-transporting ATPase subunit c